MRTLRLALTCLIFLALTACNLPIPHPSHSLSASPISASVAPSVDPASSSTSLTGSLSLYTPPPFPPKPLQWPVLQKGSSGLPVVRLQQLLAWLGYLPLTWQSAPAAPTANPVASPAGFLTTLQNPPAGAFAWRYPNIPAALHSLWQPGRYNVLVEGAVMSLQQADGLDVDGIAGPQVWNALMRDVQTHTWNPYGYSFALVSLQPPERFTLWHNGAVAVTCLANTGIPESPTMPGTYPVYLQFESQTMRGTDPWGHPYEDPGVPWVSYFDEGEAVHGFVRDSYGTPQSLGCVELPIPQAKAAFALMHLGTLVSVQK